MITNIINHLNFSILGNTVASYIVAAGLFWALLITLQFLIHTVMRRLENKLKKKDGNLIPFLFDEFERTIYPVLYVGIVYLSVKQLTLNPSIDNLLNIMGIVVLVIQGTRFLLSAVTRLLSQFWLQKETDKSTKTAKETILTLLKVAVWGLAVVLILENLGFNVSAVIAGLGIGGVAVALAAQTILGDLFNYFVIFFDKPFREGDSIDMGDNFIGEIERIGLKSTRIRAVTGEQIIVSNSDLTGNRIRNFKRMEKRRVLFQIGVVYDTSLQKMKKAVDILKKIIKDTEDTEIDRVHFKEFADSSLIIEVVFFYLGPDISDSLDVRQEINFKIKEAFEKEEIEFAFPTRTLYLNQIGSQGK